MTHQQQPSTQWSRDFLKCDQCRKEHKKCLPRARDWKGQQQKCDRCYRLGHPCGPAMRKQKSVPTDRSGVTESLRPLRRQTPRHDVPATHTIHSSASQARPTETRSCHEESTCLVKLAVMIASHELLLSQQLFLKRNSQNSMSEATKTEAVGGIISTAIRQIENAFKRATRSVQAKIARLRGVEGQLLGWKMAYFDEWHYRLSNVKSLFEARPYVSARDRRAKCMPLDTAEARILLCTSGVFQGTHMESRTGCDGSYLDQEDYLGLEAHIKNLFLDIQDFEADSVAPALGARSERSSLQELNSFPASHIAYFNQDRGTALQLWKRLPDQSVDIVRRSFVHIAVASQDLETVKKIMKHAPEALKHARRDQLGLYPMDLVSGPGSQNMQALLRDAGAKSVSDTCRVLARLAETQDCSSFASRLRNNDFWTGTHVDASRDLEVIQFCPPEIQMSDSTDTVDSMNFGHYPALDQNLAYDSYVMHGEGNTFQSAQPFGNQVQFGLQNNAYTTSGSQFTQSHNYNPFHYTG